MAITSTGIGSNLDIESLVTQLMAIEKRPLTTLATKEASYKTKLTAFGTIKSAVSQFQTAVKALSSASKFQAAKASIGDSTVATASAASGAAPGTYALEVTKLAQAQKLVATGQASDTAMIGNGVLTFDFGNISGGSLNEGTGEYTGAAFTSNGSGAKTVTIDASNHTLAGIRDAINKAKIGVTATIVNDGGASPYRLALSVNNTGADNSLKISVSGDAALSSLLAYDVGPTGSQNLSQTMAAQNATFKVDGISVTKSSNTITDVIAGVTLNLTKANSGSTTNVTVARDTESVKTAVNSFVTAYNDINKTLKSLSAYDATTKTAAILNGDSSVRSIQTQLRSVLGTPIAGGTSTFTILAQIGVSLQKDGTLAVDSTKLQTALDKNFDDVAGLFAATGKATDSLLSYTNATSKTKPGSYSVEVTSLATQGNIAGALLTFPLTVDSDHNSLQVKVDNKTATVTLAEKEYASAEELALELQSKINGASEFVSAGSSVTVTAQGGQMAITSKRYGSSSNVSIEGGTARDLFGFASATGIAGADVAGKINGVAASGSGQYLTGATGNASEGLQIMVAGGNWGPGVMRGTVSYSQGYAYQFDRLADYFLSSDGPISSRTDGINDSLKRIAKEEERLNDRMEQIEKRYRAQFTALDTLMSRMTSTSNFLTQQLAGLAGSSSD